MSMMTMHLGSRRIESMSSASARVQVATDTTTLADMRLGEVAFIVDVCDKADPAAARRLFDLGFAPGEQVEMVRKAPMADPAVFRIAGYDIALRRAQARCIEVATTR